jgi:3-(3-hydroxy-phenyl)propionate hydroxylase
MAGPRHGEMSVVIVGAGPTGVVAALDAAQRGFQVDLLEAAESISDAPRAATFHPPTLEMLARLGIIEEFTAVGLVARHFDFWDKPSRTLTARFDHDVLRDDTPYPYVVQTEQHKLVRIALDRLAAHPNARVHIGTAATAVTQDADAAEVTATGPEGTRVFRADVVVGCDGGRSTIRKSLGVEFEGYTWPERFLVLTTTTDFQAELGCSFRNYLADPQEWTNLFKVAGDDGKGRWRAVFAARPDEPDDEVLGDPASERRLRGVLPSAGLDGLVHRNIYHVHQRVAARFRVGRVFLAGDAAHVNNPIGGLGLNCGIHDVTELMATLAEARPSGDQSLWDRYDRRRRAINIKYVQEQTVANKRRLEETDPERRRARAEELRQQASDEARQREFLLRTSLLASLAESRAID